MSLPVIDPQHSFDLFDLIQGKGQIFGQHFYGIVSGDGTTIGDDFFKKLGATVHKIKYGQRQPMNKTAKNPNLEFPSVLAMRYMGQLPNFKVAMDSVFHKKIGNFPADQNGAALSSFNFMNLPAFSGQSQLTDVIAQLLVGTPTNPAAAYTAPTTSNTYIQQAGTVTVANNSPNVVGLDTNFTYLELGDEILIGPDFRTVEYVANDAFMTVDSNFSQANTGIPYYLVQQTTTDDNSQYTSVSSAINSITASVASVAGATPSSLIQMSDPSHAIPFMQAFSSVMGVTDADSAPVSLFSNDVFAEGYKIATDVTQHIAGLAGGQGSFGNIIQSIASGTSQFSPQNISSIVSSLGSGSNPLASLTQAGGSMPNILGMTPLGALAGQLTQIQNQAQQQGAQILAHIIKKNGNF